MNKEDERSRTPNIPASKGGEEFDFGCSAGVIPTKEEASTIIAALGKDTGTEKK